MAILVSLCPEDQKRTLRRRALKHAIRLMHARMREIRPVEDSQREYESLAADLFVLQQVVKEYAK